MLVWMHDVKKKIYFLKSFFLLFQIAFLDYIVFILTEQKVQPSFRIRDMAEQYTVNSKQVKFVPKSDIGIEDFFLTFVS